MSIPVVTSGTADYVGVVLPGGNIVARGSIPSGGGSGDIVPGLGIYTITNSGTVTIGNTGTISQPTDSGLGIYLYAGRATGDGSTPLTSPAVIIAARRVSVSAAGEVQ